MAAATECDNGCWLTNPSRNRRKEKEEKDESKEMVGLVQTTGTKGMRGVLSTRTGGSNLTA